MKISEFMQDLYDFTDYSPETYAPGKTCDTLKVGNPENELKKIVVTMFATPNVIRQAAEWGANLIIVHEPLFYDHWDDPEKRKAQTGIIRQVIDAKTKLIEDHDITIYRFHDHPHHTEKDWISLGEIKYWGLKGTWKKGAYYAVNRFELAEPMTAEKLAETLEKNLNIRHVRIAGAPDTLCKNLALCFGTPGHLGDEIADCDAVLTGEICEWMQEWNRDLAELGMAKKALLVMGHIASERDGMRLAADRIKEHYPDLEVRYIECGELYQR